MHIEMDSKDKNGCDSNEVVPSASAAKSALPTSSRAASNMDVVRRDVDVTQSKPINLQLDTQLIGSKRKIDALKCNPTQMDKRLKSNEMVGEGCHPTNSLGDHSVETEMNSAELKGTTIIQEFHSQSKIPTARHRNRSGDREHRNSEFTVFKKKKTSIHRKAQNCINTNIPTPSLSRTYLNGDDQHRVVPPTSSLESPNFSTSEQRCLNENSNFDSPTLTDIFNIRFNGNHEIDFMITYVDRCYINVACISVLVWVLMASISFYIGSQTGHLEKLTGVERDAPMIASILLGASLFGTILPYFIRRKTIHFSGVMLCAIVVQAVAFGTDLMLVHFPTPVFIDPVCGTKVYLLRWCEWTPLAFVMTFLAESCRIEKNDCGSTLEFLSSNFTKLGDFQDVGHSGFSEDGTPSFENDRINKNVEEEYKRRKGTKTFLAPAFRLAMCQGMSTGCAFLLPFCPGLISWSCVMSFSFCLYLTMFYRLHNRVDAFSLMKMGKSTAEKEFYEWSKLSLILLKSCTALWTVLVVTFSIYSIGPVLFPEDEFLNIVGLPIICESIIDVLFKSIYMTIISEVHDTIFDRGARSERRCEEMKQLMGAVWSNSSDIICISVKNSDGGVTSMLSPTYLRIYGMGGTRKSEDEVVNESQVISFEIERESLQRLQSAKDGGGAIAMARKFVPKHLYNVDLAECRNSSDKDFSRIDIKSLKDEEIGSMGHLVVRAWNSDKDESLLMHDLVRIKQSSESIIFQCEAKITKVDKNAILIVVRDISERFKRFEAEKKVISETTARLKDAAANRFTRHEVKNGLLAAIGLCDSLRETSLSESNDLVFQAHLASKAEDLQKYVAFPNDRIKVTGPQSLSRYLFELDKTLNEVLDTILAEAMARDVIHEVYQPKLERVNLPKLLNSTMNLTSDSQNIKRFPITTKPNPLPDYAIDPQLLKYIHRNAISNACKYGKRGGEIRTEVTWNQNDGILRIDVINLPGPCHEQILKLGNAASDIVFSPRRRLAVHASASVKAASYSAGDGAWIMKKCAMTLRGSCKIKFASSGTVFTFKCPVDPYHETHQVGNIFHEDFELPKNVWGIALDDSKIQRKLLVRFFMYAGIPQDRVHIKGGTTREIKDFHNWAIKFIDEHPHDYFLLIIDENLDIQEEEDATSQVTISGSLAVSKMRSQLLLDQERRVLALIRSANDSASDVAIYNARAHGFLPKAPIKKKSLREVLVPLWLSRFPDACRTLCSNQVACHDQGTEIIITMMDLFPTIHEIDTYASLQKDQIAHKWNLIWEKLHALKGDLLIMPIEPRIKDAIEVISGFRGAAPPEKFNETWYNVRSSLLKVHSQS